MLNNQWIHIHETLKTPAASGRHVDSSQSHAPSATREGFVGSEQSVCGFQFGCRSVGLKLGRFLLS